MMANQDNILGLERLLEKFDAELKRSARPGTVRNGWLSGASWCRLP
jgi:hypothetical protein